MNKLILMGAVAFLLSLSAHGAWTMKERATEFNRCMQSGLSKHPGVDVKIAKGVCNCMVNAVATQYPYQNLDKQLPDNNPKWVIDADACTRRFVKRMRHEKNN